MKHFAFLFILTLLASATAFASGTATGIAQIIMQSDEIETIQLTQDIELHNRVDGQGCVLIGTVNGESKVLGYSHSNAMDNKNLPTEFQALLDNYSQRVSKPHQTYTDKATVLSVPYQIIVEPLLGDVAWVQSDPFNSKLPKIDNQDVSVGCVGLAFAMLMNYHKWPEQGSGVLSYTWYRPNFTTEKISLKLGHKYEWDKIQKSYWQYDGRTSEEIDAVATLCRDMAYAAHTDFTTWSSGGSTYYALRRLIENFDYDPGIRAASLNSMKQSDYVNTLKTELKAGRPCLFQSGNTPAGQGAHAYICDGFDSNDFFHFNFGWGSSCTDMYYSIAPDGLLGDGQAFYYGIKKNEGGEPAISLFTSSDFYKGTSSTIDCGLGFSYYGLPRYVRVGYAVENISTKEIFYYETQRVISEDETGATWGDFQVTIKDTPNKDGDYIVYPVGGFADGPWIKYTFGELYRDHFCLSVKNGQKTYSNPDITFPLEGDRVEIDNVIYLLDDENHTATITFRNQRFDHYGDNITLSPSVKFNGKEYSVNKIGDQAFYRIKPAFRSITIPATIEEIGEKAFAGVCETEGYINEINITESSVLKKIGYAAFYGCDLNSIQFPSGVKEIGDEAFTYCPLDIIDIPESVESIGYRAFTTFGQARKVDVYVHWMTLSDKNINWYAFDESGTTPAYRPYRILHIPKGTIDMYREQASSFFDEIIEDQEAGISDVTIDTDTANKEIYTLQGIKVDADAELQPGIYIIVTNGNARKIYLSGKL